MCLIILEHYASKYYDFLSKIMQYCWKEETNRSIRPEVFLGKSVLKICSKFTGEHPCRSVISIKLQSNFIEIALQHGCSPVNLLHIFRTSFPKNTSRRLLLNKAVKKIEHRLTTSSVSIYFLMSIHNTRFVHLNKSPSSMIK